MNLTTVAKQFSLLNATYIIQYVTHFHHLYISFRIVSASKQKKNNFSSPQGHVRKKRAVQSRRNNRQYNLTLFYTRRVFLFWFLFFFVFFFYVRRRQNQRGRGKRGTGQGRTFARKFFGEGEDPSLGSLFTQDRFPLRRSVISRRDRRPLIWLYTLPVRTSESVPVPRKKGGNY